MNAGEKENSLESIRHLCSEKCIDIQTMLNDLIWRITIDISQDFGFNFEYGEGISNPGLICVDSDSIGQYQPGQVETQNTIRPKSQRTGKKERHGPRYHRGTNSNMLRCEPRIFLDNS